MELQEKDQFTKILERAMSAYQKPLPEKAALEDWWNLLKRYPLRAVGMAFAAYIDQEDRFAPLPAAIAKRCKLMDGRPTADEAWAIALTSRDESDTVVWTEEAAQAFALCRPVLDMRDEVGARRSFIDAYNRLVGEARMVNQPAKWNVSLGWDMKKREASLERAHVAGHLSAPAVQSLLPNYSGAGAVKQEGSPEGLKRVKEALKELRGSWDRAAQVRAAKVAAAREAEVQRKAEIAAQVAEYGDNVIQLKAQA